MLITSKVNGICYSKNVTTYYLFNQIFSLLYYLISILEEPQKPVPPPRHSLDGRGGCQQQPSMSPRRENLLDGASASPSSR